MPPPQPVPQAGPTQTVFDVATFDAALQLLQDQRQRGFRIDIETDSTVMADAQAEQQASAVAELRVVAAELVAGIDHRARLGGGPDLVPGEQFGEQRLLGFGRVEIPMFGSPYSPDDDGLQNAAERLTDRIMELQSASNQGHMIAGHG